MSFICMLVPLDRAWTVGRISIKLSIYRSFSVINGCPVNMSIIPPKIGALQMDPKTQSANFLQDSSEDFKYISLIYGQNRPK
jgi:hypothetical protein